ncbi:hypothetical protein HXA34_01560 [Salipaludibacillus agaradhaerens]|uniref:STM3941 family protein n=1 Tax=Salipaludibacillus agaradhaerens TaxID=76935 RepID=UPI002151E767|nr:STM3941 family protein [Salipaludibacillus agaradhaerens]MCR6104970.1 hypothetical protein [Salipaludibacillus agaradhaerens]MCR6117015.1 hypothetical protein [Salipaludibacillus agaradhaerens]
MEELQFYPSKGKNFILLLLCLAFIALGFLMCVVTFNDGDYVISALGAVTGLFFAFLFIMLVKQQRTSKPYLILTKEELITSAASKNPIPIAWQDIRGYNLIKVNGSKILEIMLEDEEKYRLQMTKTTRWLNKLNDAMNFAPFAIALGQVKRKDRDKLLNELDKRTFGEDLTMEEA